MSHYRKYYVFGWLLSKYIQFHCHRNYYTRIHKIAQYFKLSHRDVHECVYFP